MPITIDLKNQIAAFRRKFGRTGAEKRLRSAGLSKSMVQKLLADTYPNQPKGFYAIALNKVLNCNKGRKAKPTRRLKCRI